MRRHGTQTLQKKKLQGRNQGTRLKAASRYDVKALLRMLIEKELERKKKER